MANGDFGQGFIESFLTGARIAEGLNAKKREKKAFALEKLLVHAQLERLKAEEAFDEAQLERDRFNDAQIRRETATKNALEEIRLRTGQPGNFLPTFGTDPSSSDPRERGIADLSTHLGDPNVAPAFSQAPVMVPSPTRGPPIPIRPQTEEEQLVQHLQETKRARAGEIDLFREKAGITGAQNRLTEGAKTAGKIRGIEAETAGRIEEEGVEQEGRTDLERQKQAGQKRRDEAAAKREGLRFFSALGGSDEKKKKQTALDLLVEKGWIGQLPRAETFRLPTPEEFEPFKAEAAKLLESQDIDPNSEAGQRIFRESIATLLEASGFKVEVW